MINHIRMLGVDTENSCFWEGDKSYVMGLE